MSTWAGDMQGLLWVLYILVHTQVQCQTGLHLHTACTRIYRTLVFGIKIEMLVVENADSPAIRHVEKPFDLHLRVAVHTSASVWGLVAL